MLPRPDSAARDRRLALAALIATALSIVIVHRANEGAWLSGEGWLSSILFAASLLAILGLHEFGHHAVARRHGLRVSWPLFLPAPFFVGTLGAILRIYDRPKSRAARLEMGASGPIAGFIVIGALWGARLWGVPLLGLPPLPETGEVLARPLLWWLLAAPLSHPAPALTSDDPIAYAGWVGALVTSLNLLPFGQLDGGHVAHALSPARARLIGLAVTLLLAGLGVLWPGYWAWMFAIHLLAPHPPPPGAGREHALPARAKGVAVAALLVWGLCVTPVPW